jgi:hypothetical protein
MLQEIHTINLRGGHFLNRPSIPDTANLSR